jgi:hypothetical protein
MLLQNVATCSNYVATVCVRDVCVRDVCGGTAISAFMRAGPPPQTSFIAASSDRTINYSEVVALSGPEHSSRRKHVNS